RCECSAILLNSNSVGSARNSTTCKSEKSSIMACTNFLTTFKSVSILLATPSIIPSSHCSLYPRPRCCRMRSTRRGEKDDVLFGDNRSRRNRRHCRFTTDFGQRNHQREESIGLRTWTRLDVHHDVGSAI